MRESDLRAAVGNARAKLHVLVGVDKSKLSKSELARIEARKQQLRVRRDTHAAEVRRLVEARRPEQPERPRDEHGRFLPSDTDTTDEE